MSRKEFVKYISQDNVGGHKQREFNVKINFPDFYNEILNWSETYKLYPKNFNESLLYFLYETKKYGRCPEIYEEKDIKKLIEKYINFYIHATNNITEHLVKDKWPGLYKYIIKYCEKFDNVVIWKEKLYLFFNQINNIPKCKYCKENSKLCNKTIGYQQFCSKKCKSEYLKNDKNRNLKIANTLQENCNERYKEKYVNFNFEIKRNYENVIIKNYCIHGDLILKIGVFDHVYNYVKGKKIYCKLCGEDIIKNYNPTNDDFIFYLNLINLIKIYKSWYILLYYPKLYKCIISFTKQYKNISWGERLYLFKNNIKNKPKCEKINCDNYCCYKNSRYLLGCEIHKNSFGLFGNAKQQYKNTKLYYQCGNEYDFLEKYYDLLNIENGLVFKYINIENKASKY